MGPWELLIVPKKLQSCIKKKKKKKSGTVTRNARLGRKAQNRGVLPAPLAKATRGGHGNKLVISETL